MKSKYYYIFIMLLLTLFGLSSCSSQSQDSSVNITFSEYYQNAADFDKIHPLLIEYFSLIRNAYDKSDKTNLESFELPKEFTDISNELSVIANDNSGSIIDGKTNLSQEYLARLQLLEPYLRMEVYLSQRELLLSNNSNSNTDWFNEINDFLTNTYDKYKNETGNN